MLQRNNLTKRRLSPLTISNKRSGNNVSGKGIITPRHETSIVLYFNEINSRDCDPILKGSEPELFEAFKAGKKAKELIRLHKRNPNYPAPTDVTYDAIKLGEQAKEVLIKSNLRFVVSVAKHYQNQGLPFEDLVGEGNVGLVKSLDKFDTDKNIKFLSYAVWWIRQSILQSLVDNGKMVRIPINKKDSLTRVKRRIAKMEQELQRKPTTEEIVESMADAGLDLDVEDINNILLSELTQLSLDAPLQNKNGDEDGTMIDTLISTDYYTGQKEQEILSEIDTMLNKLEPHERAIVEMYYGVFPGQTMEEIMAKQDRKYTLEEIGEKFKLTRERIRQIKVKAIRKLRDSHNPKLKELFEYAIHE